ncbi:hypothetical protein [Streptomyces sp. NPDC005301]|uniref:hypothetical protein n=1 Tax=Streptomyces sp. NPDC005301 TaxID=3156874 RepID=UPI0033BB95A7
MTRDLLRDLAAVLVAALLVVAAVLVGTAIERDDGTLHVGWPPLYAYWEPHMGPGTPAALVVAAAVVAYGPRLAARLPWRALLGAAWATATAWTFSLALVDGWQRGIARRLTTAYEYLQVIDRFDDIPRALREFTGHILLHSPDHWPPHVAGHPPAATLTFVLLDRIGLGGGAWAGVWCIVVGATAAMAVLVTVRALAGEDLARRAAPFLVSAPAAVWAGTSADGYFAAVAAWAVALLALAVTGRRPRTAALGSGLLFGLTGYLSYGLMLIALVAGTVLLLGRRRRRVLPFLLAGAAVVPLVFALLGFDWWEAYRLLVERYYEGAGGIRPYGYWVWANLACTVLVVGPAAVAGLRRSTATAAPLARTAARSLTRRTGALPADADAPAGGSATGQADARTNGTATGPAGAQTNGTATGPAGVAVTGPVTGLPTGALTSSANGSPPGPVTGLATAPVTDPVTGLAIGPHGPGGGSESPGSQDAGSEGPGSGWRRLLGGRPLSGEQRLALLVLAAALAILAADLSGMSKAETERIWLPFAVWLPAAGALLTRPRGWLAAQTVLALLLNHLLLTGW